MSLQVLYTRCHWSEIVLCEAPVGSSIFWPSTDGPWMDGEVRGRWKVGEPKIDSLEPRVRLVPLAEEVPVSKVSAAIMSAFLRLSKARQKSGCLIVVLKGERYRAKEGKRWYTFERIGFFHLLKDESPAWKDLPSYFGAKGPKGCPTQLDRAYSPG